jgi:DNA integrity scanning protein DisA with diadenylate cyclase activity
MIDYQNNFNKMRKTNRKNQISISQVFYTRKPTIIVFLIAIIICFIYVIINLYFGNWLMNYIAKSLVIQTIFVFLTVATFISIFYPFTIRKEITKEDMLKSFDIKSTIDAKNEEIKKTAKF